MRRKTCVRRRITLIRCWHIWQTMPPAGGPLQRVVNEPAVPWYRGTVVSGMTLVFGGPFRLLFFLAGLLFRHLCGRSFVALAFWTGILMMVGGEGVASWIFIKYIHSVRCHSSLTRYLAGEKCAHLLFCLYIHYPYILYGRNYLFIYTISLLSPGLSSGSLGALLCSIILQNALSIACNPDSLPQKTVHAMLYMIGQIGGWSSSVIIPGYVCLLALLLLL